MKLGGVASGDRMEPSAVATNPAKSSWASLAQETQDLAILGKMFIRSWQDLTYIKKRMPHLDYNAKMSRSNIGSWQDCCKMLQI